MQASLRTANYQYYDYGTLDCSTRNPNNYHHEQNHHHLHHHHHQHQHFQIAANHDETSQLSQPTTDLGAQNHHQLIQQVAATSFNLCTDQGAVPQQQVTVDVIGSSNSLICYTDLSGENHEQGDQVAPEAELFSNTNEIRVCTEQTDDTHNLSSTSQQQYHLLESNRNHSELASGIGNVCATDEHGSDDTTNNLYHHHHHNQESHLSSHYQTVYYEQTNFNENCAPAQSTTTVASTSTTITSVNSDIELAAQQHSLAPNIDQSRFGPTNHLFAPDASSLFSIHQQNQHNHIYSQHHHHHHQQQQEQQDQCDSLFQYHNQSHLQDTSHCQIHQHATELHLIEQQQRSLTTTNYEIDNQPNQTHFQNHHNNHQHQNHDHQQQQQQQLVYQAQPFVLNFEKQPDGEFDSNHDELENLNLTQQRPYSQHLNTNGSKSLSAYNHQSQHQYPTTDNQALCFLRLESDNTTNELPMNESRLSRSPANSNLDLSESSNSSAAASPSLSEASSILTRDEKRARDAKIPMTYQQIVNLSIDQFNEQLAKYNLTESQLGLIKDIRRRGKNKVAAQSCRKRKMEQIYELQHEVNHLANERRSLESEYNQLVKQHGNIVQRYNRIDTIIQESLQDQALFSNK